jgi:hypothetical protein
VVACVRPEAVDLVEPGTAEDGEGVTLLPGRVVLERLRGATSTLTLSLEGAGREVRAAAPLRVEVEVPVRSYEALGGHRRDRWVLRVRPSVVHVLRSSRPSSVHEP